MSVKISAKVWEWSQAEGTDRLVMLALADFCDDDGVCFPGVARIAKKCRISERTVQRAFASLAKIGELSIVEKSGAMTNGGATNRFTLSVKGGDRLTGGVAQGGDNQGQKVVTNGAQGGDTAMSPKPSVEPSDKPSGRFALPFPLENIEGFADEWESFKASRKKLRKPMTERAENLILDKLALFPRAAVAVLRECIERGWQSFKWEWPEIAKLPGGPIAFPGTGINEEKTEESEYLRKLAIRRKYGVGG